MPIDDATFVSSTAERIAQTECKVCGGALTIHQGLGSGVCDKPECKQAMIDDAIEHRISRHRRLFPWEVEAAIEHLAEPIAEARKAIGSEDGSDVVTSIVPYQNTPVVPLPDARKEAFEAHLRSVVAKSFDNEMRPPDMERRAFLEKPHHDVMNTACMTCQGWCCKSGGDKAYLGRVDIDQWRIKNPEDGPDDIIDFYLSQLPDASVDGHCVMQGPEGCVMDRSVRANICNHHLCSGLRMAEQGLHESETGRVIYISRNDDMEPVRVMGWSPQTGAVEVPVPDALKTPLASDEPET